MDYTFVFRDSDGHVEIIRTNGCFGLDETTPVARKLAARTLQTPEESLEEIAVFEGRNDKILRFAQ